MSSTGCGSFPRSSPREFKVPCGEARKLIEAEGRQGNAKFPKPQDSRKAAVRPLMS